MKLAINGGKPIRNKPFNKYNLIDDKEINSTIKVLKSGVLSGFMGGYNSGFLGGKEVIKFENNFSNKLNVKYAISVNSASSALQIALKACDIKAGDEVIVSPYSMSISATAPLLWNAIPIFADIEEKTFALSYDSIKKLITPKTKAIILVHIFGAVARDTKKILKLAKKHNIKVIEDASQSPMAYYDKNSYAGTLADIGVFSLNCHKHINCGEGGVCVTNNKEIATKLQLLRNHAEAVVPNMNNQDKQKYKHLFGFNFRLTELQAVIANEQLKKLKKELKIRRKYALMYNKALSKIPFIEVQDINPISHSYYVQPFIFNEKIAGVSRHTFIEAVKKELSYVKGEKALGVPIYEGYTKPLYLLDIFQTIDNKKYSQGICPMVEKMYYKKLFWHDFTKSSLSIKDVNDVILAYQKVSKAIDELK